MLGVPERPYRRSPSLQVVSFLLEKGKWKRKPTSERWWCLQFTVAKFVEYHERTAPSLVNIMCSRETVYIFDSSKDEHEQLYCSDHLWEMLLIQYSNSWKHLKSSLLCASRNIVWSIGTLMSKLCPRHVTCQGHVTDLDHNLDFGVPENQSQRCTILVLACGDCIHPPCSGLRCKDSPKYICFLYLNYF